MGAKPSFIDYFGSPQSDLFHGMDRGDPDPGRKRPSSYGGSGGGPVSSSTTGPLSSTTGTAGSFDPGEDHAYRRELQRVRDEQIARDARELRERLARPDARTSPSRRAQGIAEAGHSQRLAQAARPAFPPLGRAYPPIPQTVIDRAFPRLPQIAGPAAPQQEALQVPEPAASS